MEEQQLHISTPEFHIEH